jgi:hypothetical protein
MNASYSGHEEVCKLLVGNGADTNATNNVSGERDE